MYNVLHLTLMWLGSYKCVSDKKILVLSWHKMSFDIFLGCLWCNDRRSYRWTLGGGAAGLQVKTWIWCQLKSFFVVSCPRWSDTKLCFEQMQEWHFGSEWWSWFDQDQVQMSKHWQIQYSWGTEGLACLYQETCQVEWRKLSLMA